MVGEFARERRERLVLATKYTLTTRRGDPNSGGNHRKSMVRSVEQSLERLQTDYINLLYMHIWDGTTPVEEIMRALDDLVRAGKILYAGMSDTPAWQVARMQTLADVRAYTPLIALQIEYSLAQRTVERDLIPMARELGLGVIPWSPLASGVLTGKYSLEDLEVQREGQGAHGTRRDIAAGNGSLTEKSLEIAQVNKQLAAELSVTPSQLAIHWTLLNPAVTAPIVGARTLAQLEDNLKALEIEVPAAARARLDEVSRVELGFPHDFVKLPQTQAVMRAGTIIEPRV